MLIEADLYEDYVLCDKQRSRGDGGDGDRSEATAAEESAKNPPCAPVVKEKKGSIDEEKLKKAAVAMRDDVRSLLRDARRDYRAYRLQSLGFLALSTALFVAVLAIVVWQHGQISALKERVEQLSVVFYDESSGAAGGGGVGGGVGVGIGKALSIIENLRSRCSSFFPGSLCSKGGGILGRWRSS